MGLRIGNVVFDAPSSTLTEYAAAAGGIADLYAELLGMRRWSRGEWYRSLDYEADEGDDADPLVMDDDPGRPNLAFEWAGADYVAPAWPDPARPQQLHLDLAVPDLDAADAVARRHGARLLRTADDHRTYADVVGHPFCLYPDAGRPRIARVVFDGPDPDRLAAFWHGLLDDPLPGAPTLAFQHSDGPAPTWPSPGVPQQLHLDLASDDETDAQALAERLGATRLPYVGGGFVWADPAGHPFCAGE